MEDLDEIKMVDAIADLGRALLVMHSPVDKVVGIDNASMIFRTAKHPKSFVSLDRADHLLTDAADSRYAAGVIANWSKKYIPVIQEEAKLATAEGNGWWSVRAPAASAPKCWPTATP